MAKAKKKDAPNAKNPLDVRIGKRIAEMRDQMGLSTQELATRTNVLSKSRIGNYEQGSRRPDIEAARALGEVLGESAAHILCLDDDNPVLSDTERTMIHSFRWLPPDLKATYVRRIVETGKAWEPTEYTDDQTKVQEFSGVSKRASPRPARALNARATPHKPESKKRIR